MSAAAYVEFAQQLDRIALPIAVAVLVNVPINQQVATWNPAALPTGYEDLLRRWWAWHQVRLAAMFTGMCLGFAAMLSRGHATAR